MSATQETQIFSDYFTNEETTVAVVAVGEQRFKVVERYLNNLQDYSHVSKRFQHLLYYV